jgi:hypothetical protein
MDNIPDPAHVRHCSSASPDLAQVTHSTRWEEPEFHSFSWLEQLTRACAPPSPPPILPKTGSPVLRLAAAALDAENMPGEACTSLFMSLICSTFCILQFILCEAACKPQNSSEVVMGSLALSLSSSLSLSFSLSLPPHPLPHAKTTALQDYVRSKSRPRRLCVAANHRRESGSGCCTSWAGIRRCRQRRVATS